jgi:hypothetical protein
LKRRLLSTAVLIAAILCSSASVDAADFRLGKKGKKDALVTYGKDFSLKVREPAGWKGDAKPPAQYEANVILRGKSARKSSDLVVTVRVNNKTDENIEKDIKADMEIYRKSFPGVRFDSLDVKHPYYKSASRLFFVDGQFYEYVCYLNPGKKSPFLLWVSLSKQKEPASGKEFDALQKIVESLEISNLENKDSQASISF